MKSLVAILSMSSLLYSAPSEEEQNVSTDPLVSESIAFDPNAFSQEPIRMNELQPPTPSFQPLQPKSSLIAVGLSYLIPGLGHIYLGDLKTAGALIGSTSAGIGTMTAFPHSQNSKLTSIVALQSISFYGIYAAYRDVRIYNQQSGYSYKMPTDSFADLTSAPFTLSILKRPEVWGGLLGALTLAIGTSYFAYPEGARIRQSLSTGVEFPLLALPVGVGEECFFRGYLQSQAAESLTPWGGIAVSSLAFGAAHIANAQFLEPENRWRYYSFSLPLITAMGAYFGWLTYKSGSLKQSVALHTWYDFTVFTASYLASQAAATGGSSFAIALPF